MTEKSTIRIGFVGLSPRGSWASIAHFPYLRQAARYRITAICNSSLARAEAAKQAFGLPPTVNVYENAVALANDPNVDLVVCSVRVDKHYDICKAAIEAGKDCLTEWPLGKGVDEAKQLYRLAQERGVRTVIGLQGRQNDAVNQIRRLVGNGVVGRVLSTTVMSAAGCLGPQELERHKYLNERAIGGDMLSIFFGHLMDMVLYCLGELRGFQSLVSTQRSRVDIMGPDSQILDTLDRTAPDHITLQGFLQSGAVISVHQRGGKSFPTTPGLDWRIYGEVGEIRITTERSYPHLVNDGIRIGIHEFSRGSVDEVRWKADAEAAPNDLASPVAEVARIYEAFAGGGAYADWAEAVKRHEMLDEVQRRSDELYMTAVRRIM